MLEDTLERGAAPWLGLLAEHGRYRRAISTFPSLTPVCLSALAARPRRRGGERYAGLRTLSRD
jgi:hypothetical protein